MYCDVVAVVAVVRIGSYDELVTHCACFVLPYVAEGRAGLLPLQRLDLDIRNSFQIISWHLAASEKSKYSACSYIENNNI